MRTASTADRAASKTIVKAAYATFAKCRERVAKMDENTTNADKASVKADLLRVLPTIREANGDDAKKVRRVLRKLGHFISRDGYVVKDRKANAKKRERKASVTTNAAPEVNADNANTNV